MEKPILPAFLSCQGPHLSDDEKRLFAKANPLGVCLFAIHCENIKNRGQINELIKEIKESVGREDVLIAVDQEGGRVRRLLEPEFTPVTEQKQITEIEQAKWHAYLISSDLQSCGINVNFAPVLDMEYSFTSEVLKGRCFDGDEHQIARLGRAMVDEYIKNGICPCVKHIPGHGRGAVDVHLELPVLQEELVALERDFYPFQQLKDTPMGMVAHILLHTVDSRYPATTSKKVIAEIIRQKIGFSGLLVSDAIVMHALKGTIRERAESVISAGCDIVCLGNADFSANEELCASGLQLSDAARERLAAVKQIIHKKTDFSDYEYIKNNYCASLKNIVTYNDKYDATEVLNRLHKR